MVAAGVGLQFLQAGLMTQSFGAYVAVLQAERGWSKTALSGAAALHQMEAAILGPALGWFMDRFGPQGMIRAGVIIFGSGLMLLSQCNELGTFYAAFLVIALGTSLCGFFPINVALINWFERWRARALSSLSFGLALGGLSVPVVAASLQTFGWRATAFASGLIAICVGWPLARVIKRRPEDHGETIDGLPAKPPATQTGPSTEALPETRDFTVREALRTRAFWLISLGHGFALLVVHAVVVHAISHMNQSLGYSVEQAALIYTLVTLSQIAGVIAGWWIGDRYEKRLICAVCMLMHMAGLLLLTYADALPATFVALLAFALLHGAA
jgi:sugar phosphate permease